MVAYSAGEFWGNDLGLFSPLLKVPNMSPNSRVVTSSSSTSRFGW